MTIPLSPVARLTCALAVGCLLGSRPGLAFPATDASSPSVTTNVPEVTESDLRHQLQLQSGLGAAAGGAGGAGWTFVPALTLQEAFTDNVLNSSVDKRWDLITLFTPSILLQGDLPNARVHVNYAPQFRLNARTPSQNGISNQLQGTGLFTIIPDAFYLDARAVSGGTPVGGGFGGVGLGGTPTLPSSSLGSLGTAGLSKQNQVQTTSMSVAPYLLHRFGETGTAKIGYQFSQSAYAQGISYVPVLFPTGSNTNYSITNEGVVQFETGERFAPFRDLFSADAKLGTGNGVNHHSRQYIVLNRLGYLVNRDITVYGEIGYESLHFGGVPPTNIDDAVWGIGVTFDPNPDSRITVGFGHKYGENAVQFNGSYALTARTRISASYSTGIQSDLLGLQSQLDLASFDTLGRTVDAQTGAPLFIGNGGIGAQAGLYRNRSFTFSANTILDRDQVSLTLQVSQTTTLSTVQPGEVVAFGIPAPPVGSTSQGKTVILSWLHQFNENWTMSSTASYTASHVSTSGNQHSLVASVAMQYLLSQTLSATARYTYFDRESATASQSFSQNMVLVGLSKQF